MTKWLALARPQTGAMAMSFEMTIRLEANKDGQYVVVVTDQFGRKATHTLSRAESREKANNLIDAQAKTA